MKKIIILMFILSLLLVNFSMAQRSNYYHITGNNYNDIKISYTIDVQNLQIQTIKTEQGSFSHIAYEGMTPMQNDGKPELPVITNLLEIPLCEGMEVTVVNSTYETYNLSELGINHPIMPVQPKHPKSEDGPFPFVIDAATYATNSFYGMELAQTEKVGILRNINMGRLTVSPFEYNPVTNELRVCTRVDVEVSFVNANIPKTMEMKTKYGNGLFDGQHSGVINPMNTPGFRDEIDNAPIKYLIVAHSMFRNNEQLTSFINWKKRIGYLVEIAFTDDSNVGTTTTSIKNFIKSKYDNATDEDPAPSFLLLIGDVAQIPAFTGVADNGHVTDLYYATWTTGDNLPDCYYGRFSAQNVSQLTPQIDKTLMYEQYTMPESRYLDNAVLVAGTDSQGHSTTHADGQIKYASTNYVNTDNGFTTVYTHLYNCSSQAATIRSEIGAGVGFANYTAHCSSSGWSDPAFETSHISSMSNANKYGILIGNCCQSGKFEESNCFAEALLRTANKGAVIYLGASDYSYWDEDYYWAVGVRSSITSTPPTYDASHLGFYDRLFHTHNEAHSQWYVTSSGINVAGNLAVESSTSSLKQYYWEIYHVFGDPSIKPYLSEPSVMNLSLPSGSVVGTTSFQITAVPYAYVALTQNNDLIAATFADANGNANLTLPSDMIPGQYEIAISAQNYVQFFQTINFASPNTFYAVSNVNLSNNSSILNNNVNNWDLKVENVSSINGNNVWVKIQPNTNNIYFTADSVYIGSMTGGQVVNLNNAFTSRTSASISDNEMISVHVTVYSNTGNFERDFNFNAQAPVLMVNNTILNAGTASVGEINPGNTGTLTFVVKNAGHASISNLTATLVSHHEHITVNNSNVTVGSITPNGTAEATFNISIDAQASVGSLYPLLFTVNNEEYELNLPYSLMIGRAMEDFESNSFTSFAWNNNNQYPWEITSSNVYAGSYSARSKSNLPDGTGSWWSGYTNTNSDLSITLNVTEASPISYFRKVSSESGYDFFSFAIDGTTMEELSGEVGWAQSSFDVTPGTHTFRFRYSKDYSNANGDDCAWIDNIIFPTSGQTMTPTSPLLVIDHYDIEGSYAGNIILNGNEPTIKVVFNNEGNTVATNIQATLSTDNSNVRINNNSGSNIVNFASMAINSSKTAQYDISFVSSPTATQDILFNFTLTSGGTSTSCPIMLTYLNGNNSGPVGIESSKTHNTSLIIYPNPSSDQINIQSSTNMKEIEVFDMTGRCVRHAINLNDNKYSFNISSLSSSIYFVRVKDENDQTLISKIIKN